MRCHPETRAYEIRRSAEGKTHRDIRRSVKRALARRLYRRIEAAARLARGRRRRLTNIGASNGLLRQYFPKGTDLSVHTAEDLDRVAAELNDRPRKRLGFRKPIEEMEPLLLR